MAWMNYHHLLYFWTAAREGGITKACKKLHLSQPTVSGQIRALEKSLRATLFERSGRSITLTETGRIVYRYADEIFSLGRELQDAIHDRPQGQALRLAVGVADALPKVLVHRLLAPALHAGEQVRVTCTDGEPDRLLAQLALHELDLTCLAVDKLARQYRGGFPRSLNAAPMLLPAGTTTLRRSLEHWFDDHEIAPRIVGEFADSALLKSFGAAGDGIFAAPTVVEAEVRKMYKVSVVGRETSIRERFYAISIEKRLKHPAVVAISQAARTSLFRD
jgi:LysR family transcriptional activator of nhaA